jgi:hypothetical protein
MPSMLVSEPDDSTPRPARIPRRSPAILLMLFLVALIVIVLRHDYWFWDTPYPLLFGFLPVGLWWQAMVSLLAAGMMWMMVHFAWPQELEDEALDLEQQRLNREDPA